MTHITGETRGKKEQKKIHSYSHLNINKEANIT